MTRPGDRPGIAGHHTAVLLPAPADALPLDPRFAGAVLDVGRPIDLDLTDRGLQLAGIDLDLAVSLERRPDAVTVVLADGEFRTFHPESWPALDALDAELRRRQGRPPFVPSPAPPGTLPFHLIVDPAGRWTIGGTLHELRRLIPTRRWVLDDTPAFTLRRSGGWSLAVGADDVALAWSGDGSRRRTEGLGDDAVSDLWVDLLAGDHRATAAIDAHDWRDEPMTTTARGERG